MLLQLRRTYNGIPLEFSMVKLKFNQSASPTTTHKINVGCLRPTNNQFNTVLTSISLNVSLLHVVLVVKVIFSQAMSESKGETLSTTAAAALASNSDDLWSKFYDQACSLLYTTQKKLLGEESKVDEEEMTKLHQRIMITLDTITKLTFGLGATKKAQVVVHGDGAVELIVALVRSSQVLNDTYKTPLSKPIILSSLKALKTCVLRNPAGRCRCRTAGVFSFLNDVLDMIQGGDNMYKQDAEDKLLIEQLYTALAAICLGDDLNAFQVSTDFFFNL